MQQIRTRKRTIKQGIIRWWELKTGKRCKECGYKLPDHSKKCSKPKRRVKDPCDTCWEVSQPPETPDVI
jgi:hypothetical protein